MRGRHNIIVDRLPAYYLFDYAIMGNFALTTKTERYILDEYAIEYEGEVNTPGHHFSTICNPIRFSKSDLYHDSLSYPYKAIPGKYPYCFYVDIWHAFSQIARVFGLDCDHIEGRYMGFGSSPLPQIFDDSKIMRALLVSGTGEKSTLQEWKNGTIQSRQFPNRNHNPMLQRAIYGFLHAIACNLSPLSLYSHTDGFIIPYIHFPKCCQYLDNHDIRYTVKCEGITEVFGIGSYRIGETRTKGPAIRQRGADNLRFDTADWWVRQWDRGKEYRG